MTIAPEREPSALDEAAVPSEPGPQWWRRALDPVPATRRRWLAHLLLLALVLGGLLAWVNNGQVMDADEGAALTQVQVLDHTGQWSMPATSALDPTGKWFPIHLSGRIGSHEYVFTRPPIYPATLAPLYRWGGLTLILGFELGCLLVAAWGAGLLVERLRPGRGIQAMWFTAVASPLLFDGFWVIAHTIAAAGFVWACYGALRVVRDRRWRWAGAWVAGLAVAVTFRNEALIACVALALGIVVLGWTERRVLSVGMGAATLAVGAAGYKGMNLYERHVQGGSHSAAYTPTLQGGLVSGRIHGFEHTMLAPGTGGSLGILLVVAVAALVIVGLVATARAALPERTVRGMLVAAAVLAVVRAVAVPVDLVTGMVMAAPALAGAFLLPKETRRDPAIRFTAIVAALTFLGVILTESQDGGGGEWGGRYFHVALPLVCALAVIGFDALIARRGQNGRIVVASAVIVALAMSVLSLREAKASRETAKTLTETAWTTALTTRSARQPGGPVVVSTWVAGGRFSWRHVLDGRYLTVDDDHDFPSLGRVLARNDIPDFVLLAQPADAPHANEIGSGYTVTRRIPLGTHGWTVDVLARQ